MAKYKVKYPKGGEVVKYVTTEKGAAEETSGRVQHLTGSRYFIRPSLGKTLTRKAGVKRVSEKVREINKRLEDLKDTENAPAVQCGGLGGWKDFVSCLRKQMKEKVFAGYTAETETPITAAEFEKKY